MKDEPWRRTDGNEQERTHMLGDTYGTDLSRRSVTIDELSAYINCIQITFFAHLTWLCSSAEYIYDANTHFHSTINIHYTYSNWKNLWTMLGKKGAFLSLGRDLAVENAYIWLLAIGYTNVAALSIHIRSFL